MENVTDQRARRQALRYQVVCTSAVRKARPIVTGGPRSPACCYRQRITENARRADRRCRPSGGHLPVRHRPSRLGPRYQLQAHELDNLHVVGTSFFPGTGAVSPALTAVANAIRVGEHLLAPLR
jgi:hypothetical protein